MYTIPLLTERLTEIAEKNLQKFSGQSKVLEVLIQFYYGPETEVKDGWDTGTQHVKVVFWHPNNAMLVGYNYETHADDIPNSFIVSSNHSSTWKHDGLNFFHEILEKPKDWKILSMKMLDVKDPVVGDEFSHSNTTGHLSTGDEFTFSTETEQQLVFVE